MAQRFIVMKYKSILPTCMIPEPGDPMGADSYAYTSLKYTYTSLKYAGVVAEPLTLVSHTFTNARSGVRSVGRHPPHRLSPADEQREVKPHEQLGALELVNLWAKPRPLNSDPDFPLSLSCDSACAWHGARLQRMHAASYSTALMDDDAGSRLSRPCSLSFAP